MATSRRPTSRSRSSKASRARRRTAEAAPDALRDAVVIPRERLRALLDDVVDRGRMTRDDARDLLRDLEGTIGMPAERVLREVGRATGLGSSFPIAGYDDLTAAQVTERLGGLSTADLLVVRDYEKRNANRKSVLAAVERKLP